MAPKPSPQVSSMATKAATAASLAAARMSAALGDGNEIVVLPAPPRKVVLIDLKDPCEDTIIERVGSNRKRPSQWSQDDTETLKTWEPLAPNQEPVAQEPVEQGPRFDSGASFSDDTIEHLWPVKDEMVKKAKKHAREAQMPWTPSRPTVGEEFLQRKPPDELRSGPRERPLIEGGRSEQVAGEQMDSIGWWDCSSTTSGRIAPHSDLSASLGKPFNQNGPQHHRQKKPKGRKLFTQEGTGLPFPLSTKFGCHLEHSYAEYGSEAAQRVCPWHWQQEAQQTGDVACGHSNSCGSLCGSTSGVGSRAKRVPKKRRHAAKVIVAAPKCGPLSSTEDWSATSLYVSKNDKQRRAILLELVHPPSRPKLEKQLNRWLVVMQRCKQCTLQLKRAGLCSAQTCPQGVQEAPNTMPNLDIIKVLSKALFHRLIPRKMYQCLRYAISCTSVAGPLCSTASFTSTPLQSMAVSPSVAGPCVGPVPSGEERSAAVAKETLSAATGTDWRKKRHTGAAKAANKVSGTVSSSNKTNSSSAETTSSSTNKRRNSCEETSITARVSGATSGQNKLQIFSAEVAAPGTDENSGEKTAATATPGTDARKNSGADVSGAVSNFGSTERGHGKASAPATRSLAVAAGLTPKASCGDVPFPPLEEVPQRLLNEDGEKLQWLVRPPESMQYNASARVPLQSSEKDVKRRELKSTEKTEEPRSKTTGSQPTTSTFVGTKALSAASRGCHSTPHPSTLEGWPKFSLPLEDPELLCLGQASSGQREDFADRVPNKYVPSFRQQADSCVFPHSEKRLKQTFMSDEAGQYCSKPLISLMGSSAAKTAKEGTAASCNEARNAGGETATAAKEPFGAMSSTNEGRSASEKAAKGAGKATGAVSKANEGKNPSAKTAAAAEKVCGAVSSTNEQENAGAKFAATGAEGVVSGATSCTREEKSINAKTASATKEVPGAVSSTNEGRTACAKAATGTGKTSGAASNVNEGRNSREKTATGAETVSGAVSDASEGKNVGAITAAAAGETVATSYTNEGKNSSGTTAAAAKEVSGAMSSTNEEKNSCAETATGAERVSGATSCTGEEKTSGVKTAAAAQKAAPSISGMMKDCRDVKGSVPATESLAADQGASTGATKPAACASLAVTASSCLDIKEEPVVFAKSGREVEVISLLDSDEEELNSKEVIMPSIRAPLETSATQSLVDDGETSELLARPEGGPSGRGASSSHKVSLQFLPFQLKVEKEAATSEIPRLRAEGATCTTRTTPAQVTSAALPEPASSLERLVSSPTCLGQCENVTSRGPRIDSFIQQLEYYGVPEHLRKACLKHALNSDMAEQPPSRSYGEGTTMSACPSAAKNPASEPPGAAEGMPGLACNSGTSGSLDERPRASATKSLDALSDLGAASNATRLGGKDEGIALVVPAKEIECVIISDSDEDESDERSTKMTTTATQQASTKKSPPPGQPVAPVLSNPLGRAVPKTEEPLSTTPASPWQPPLAVVSPNPGRATMVPKVELPLAPSSLQPSGGAAEAASCQHRGATEGPSLMPPPSPGQPRGLEVEGPPMTPSPDRTRGLEAQSEDSQNGDAVMGLSTISTPVKGILEEEAKPEESISQPMGREESPSEEEMRQEEDVRRMLRLGLQQHLFSLGTPPVLPSQGGSTSTTRATSKRRMTNDESPASMQKRPRATRVDEDDDFNESEEMPSSQEISAHDSPVVAVKLHGHFIYSSSGCYASRHDVMDPSKCVVYQGSTDTVNSLEVCSLKRQPVALYTTSLDGDLRCYDAETGDLTGRQPMGAAITCSALAWGKIYLGLKTGRIAVFNVKTKEWLGSFQRFREPVSCIATAAKGREKCKFLCAVTVGGSVAVWVESSHDVLWKLDGCAQPVPPCVGIHNGLVYMTMADERQLRDLKGGWVQKSFRSQCAAMGMRFYKTFVICFSFDGLICVSKSKDCSCVVHVYHGAGENNVTSMDVEGSLIATGNNKGILKVTKFDKSNLLPCKKQSCNVKFAREDDLVHHLRVKHSDHGTSAR